jgi:hypothetical protein
MLKYPAQDQNERSYDEEEVSTVLQFLSTLLCYSMNTNQLDDVCKEKNKENLIKLLLH